MADKLTKIDESIIADHYHLSGDDECYFWLERMSRRSYNFSVGNQLIANLKKKPSTSRQNELWYKGQAIQKCSTFLRSAVNPFWLDHATFVPIPGSKAKDHPDYDDRMLRILRGVRPAKPLDVRELIKAKESTPASHEVGEGQPRLNIGDLLRIWSIDETLANPAPTAIAVCDDVLTAAVHFRAAKQILSSRFPNVTIAGIFIARRVFPPDHTPDLDDF